MSDGHEYVMLVVVELDVEKANEAVRSIRQHAECFADRKVRGVVDRQIFQVAGSVQWLSHMSRFCKRLARRISERYRCPSMGKRRPRKKTAEPGVKVKHQRHKSAGVIVFRRDGDECLFLLVLSRLTKRPLWEFPKGGVERGETVPQAALRELIEETGISEAEVRIIPDFQRTEDYRFTAGDSGQRTLIHKQVTYYLGETDKETVTLSVKESSEFAWVSLPEAMKRVRYAKRKRLLLDAAVAIGCAKAEDYPEITSRKR